MEQPAPSNDGSGVVMNPDNDRTETMEMTEQISAETVQEVIINSFKFIQLILESLIENKKSGLINAVQLNFISDKMNKFGSYLDETIFNHPSQGDNSSTANEIDLIKYQIKCLTCLQNEDLIELKKLINMNGSDSEKNTQLDLVKIDILQFTITNIDESTSADIKWNVCTWLNTFLNNAKAQLSNRRSSLLRSNSDELSKIVFQLCDILVNASDNELIRFHLKEGGNGTSTANQKTLDILMKNAKILLKNALKIAEQPCGLQESIIDKIKRNYVYHQAQCRLELLETGSVSSRRDELELDSLREHPFYSTHF